MDPLRAASLTSQGFLSAGYIKSPNIPSPFRMMFINPRRYFETNKDWGDWTGLLSSTIRASVKEWAVNFAELDIPGSGGMITLVSEMLNDLIMGSDGSLFIFYINPTTLNVNHQKVTNEVLTGAGWDFDVLGDQVSSYSFAGTSGNMLTTIPLTNITALKLSRAYLKFVIFEQFYLYNNNDPLIMIFDHMAYLGKLTNMSWTWDANDIYQIKYNFTWRCDPVLSFDPVTGVGVTQMFERSDIIDIMYPREIQPDWYLAKTSTIDAYETGLRLYEESTSGS